MLGTLAASYAGCDKVKVVALFTVGMATMGFFYSSMKVNVMDLSPNYAGPAMAMVNGVGAVAGIVSPPLIGYLIPNVIIISFYNEILSVARELLVLKRCIFNFCDCVTYSF